MDGTRGKIAGASNAAAAVGIPMILGKETHQRLRAVISKRQGSPCETAVDVSTRLGEHLAEQAL